MEAMAILLCSKLVALNCLIQFLEYFSLRGEISPHGIWGGSRLVYGLSLLAIGLGIVSSIIHFLFSDPLTITILFMSSVFMMARFRGSFNGGSDSMTAIVLFSVMVSLWFQNSPGVVKVALLYIAVQSVLSYVVAGLAKLSHREWRSGMALTRILLDSNYPISPFVKRWAKFPHLMFSLSWGVILFECAFPMIFFTSIIALPVLALGFAFHVINAYVFGLNRFIFSWLATYPAVYYVVSSI